MYDKEDLLSLADFLKLSSHDLIQKKEEDPENENKSVELLQVARQLDAIYYNPLLFQTILEEYDVPFSILEEPLEEVALHINDAGAISKAIVQWRLTNST